MVNFFLKRFENKTEAELREILKFERYYQPAAIEAAKTLLINRSGNSPDVVPLPEPKPQSPQYLRSRHPYFRTFSYREVLSALASAFLLMALLHIVGLYNDDLIDMEIGVYVKWSIFFLIYSLNHLLYRLDHKRSNGFWTRYLQSCILLTIIGCLIISLDIIKQEPINLTDYGTLLVAIPFLSMAFEITYSILQFMCIQLWRKLQNSK